MLTRFTRSAIAPLVWGEGVKKGSVKALRVFSLVKSFEEYKLLIVKNLS